MEIYIAAASLIISLAPLVQTFRAKTGFVTYTEPDHSHSTSYSIRKKFLHRQHHSDDSYSRGDASAMTTTLKSLGLGTTVIYPLYLHNLPLLAPLTAILIHKHSSTPVA